MFRGPKNEVGATISGGATIKGNTVLEITVINLLHMPQTLF